MSDVPRQPSRRGFFLGAAATGAAAASLVSLRSAPEATLTAEAARPAPERGGGYSLSEHVKRYYKTTRV
ncbi:MAG: formate dehydrogenase [Rhodoferax sp.]|nr:formate dehydrogenase [Rhodoferax sp.]